MGGLADINIRTIEEAPPSLEKQINIWVFSSKIKAAAGWRQWPGGRCLNNASDFLVSQRVRESRSQWGNHNTSLGFISSYNDCDVPGSTKAATASSHKPQIRWSESQNTRLLSFNSDFYKLLQLHDYKFKHVLNPFQINWREKERECRIQEYCSCTCFTVLLFTLGTSWSLRTNNEESEESWIHKADTDEDEQV